LQLAAGFWAANQAQETQPAFKPRYASHSKTD
jgi:hypothetical protein